MISMRPEGHHFREGLLEFVDHLPDDLIMAEVGSYAGESAALFLRKASLIYCVDVWGFPGDEVERRFDIMALGYPSRVIKLRGPSSKMADSIPDGVLDLVYIDADHAFCSVLEDLNLWVSKVKNGGIVSGHDFGSIWPGVGPAVRSMLGTPDRIFKDDSWVKVLKI